MLEKDFWKDRQVLVTGHTGFKGSWLSQSLVFLGSEVTGVSLNPPTNPNLYSLLDFKDLRDIRLDIRDRSKLIEVFNEVKPEVIFHLAAQPIVRYSYLNPIETYEVNFMGTLNVLEAIKQQEKIKAAVIVTTDKCYENVEKKEGYIESDPMGGYDPYSSSKGAAELLVSSYRNSFFSGDSLLANVATARAGNVIGGGDWAQDRLMPDIINFLLKNKDIVIRNPKHVRPWQHVLEPTFGYLKLAKALFEKGEDFASGWNFGPDEEDAKSVEWISKTMINKWGSSVGVKFANEHDLHEANYLKLNCSKARENLKWYPKLNVSEALDYIVDWYRLYESKINPRDILSNQISDYINK